MLFFFCSFSSLELIVVFVRESTRKLCAPFWICDLFVGHSAGWLDKCVSRTKTKTPVRFPVDGTTKRREEGVASYHCFQITSMLGVKHECHKGCDD